MRMSRAIKYALETMLVLNFILSLIPLLINPEAWSFSYKLGGIKASCWLLTNGIIGLILAYSLFKNVRYSYLAVLIFFLVNFVNVITNTNAFSPFYFSGTVLSLAGFVLKMKK